MIGASRISTDLGADASRSYFPFWRVRPSVSTSSEDFQRNFHISASPDDFAIIVTESFDTSLPWETSFLRDRAFLCVRIDGSRIEVLVILQGLIRSCIPGQRHRCSQFFELMPLRTFDYDYKSGTVM